MIKTNCKRGFCLDSDHNGKKRLALLLVCAIGLLGAGCVDTILPPQMSVAKFVRQNNTQPEVKPASEGTEGAKPAEEENQESRGKVSAATGILFNVVKHDIGGSSDSDSMMYLFPVEGAFTGWVGDTYDLSISVNNYGLMGLEANGVFVSNDVVRLGILHGVQIGAMRELESDSDGLWGLGVSAGLFMQTTGNANSSFFAAGRYAFNGITESGEFESDFSFHHAIFSIGGAFSKGRLQVIPELVFDAGYLRDTDLVNYMIVPTITVSSNY